jgi:hypothetical protein
MFRRWVINAAGSAREQAAGRSSLRSTASQLKAIFQPVAACQVESNDASLQLRFQPKQVAAYYSATTGTRLCIVMH